MNRRLVPVLLLVAVGLPAGCGPGNPARAWLAPPEQPYVFQRTVGGEKNDVGNALLETADGGFLLIGYTESFGRGGKDLWLIRTDLNGDTLWTRTYGGEADDYGWDVATARGGGFVAVGFTASRGAGGEDLWLLRLDEDGDTLWSRTYGGPGDERGWALSPTEDGGHVIAGRSRREGSEDIDLFLLRVDAAGDVVWTIDQSATTVDRVFSVEPMGDGTFVFAGSRSQAPSADRDAYLVRVGASGELLWERSFGSPEDEVARDVVRTRDGGLLLVGHARESQMRGEDLYLVRTGPDGRELWSRRIGDVRDEQGNTATAVSSGGYVVAGYTRTEAGDWDIYVLKVDEEGEEGWSELFGAAGSDRALMVREAADGDFVLVGAVGVVEDGAFDLVLIKFEGGED